MSCRADTAQVCNLAKWLFQIRSARPLARFIFPSRSNLLSRKKKRKKKRHVINIARGRVKSGGEQSIKGWKIIANCNEHLDDDSTYIRIIMRLVSLLFLYAVQELLTLLYRWLGNTGSDNERFGGMLQAFRGPEKLKPKMLFDVIETLKIIQGTWRCIEVVDLSRVPALRAGDGCSWHPGENAGCLAVMLIRWL